MRLIKSLCCAAACIFLSTAALGQNLTPEELEMVKKFQRHPKLGLPRGIVAATPAETTEPSKADYVEVAPEDVVSKMILFDFNSWVLRPDQEAKLISLCNVVKHMEGDSFQVVGHTDASGSELYNEWLSRLRAEAVERHLVENCGIEKNRLRAIGVGEDHLLHPERPMDDGNRRVEFQRSG